MLLRTAALATVLLLSACASTREPTLADQIRARAQLRVDIAEALEAGEAKVKKGRKLAHEAADLHEDATEDQNKGNKLLEAAKTQQNKADKLQAEADALINEGKGQIAKAEAEYRAVNIQPVLEIPAKP